MQDPVVVSSVAKFFSEVNTDETRNPWLDAEIKRRGLEDKRVRSAVTGEFVEKKEAIFRPRETVAETVKKRSRR